MQKRWTKTRQGRLLFADEAWEDYLYWQKQDTRMVERINKLIRETQREPFAGVGKPEPLKHALAGFWSRRITDEHRMVYRVEGKILMIAQLRVHYLGPVQPTAPAHSLNTSSSTHSPLPPVFILHARCRAPACKKWRDDARVGIPRATNTGCG